MLLHRCRAALAKVVTCNLKAWIDQFDPEDEDGDLHQLQLRDCHRLVATIATSLPSLEALHLEVMETDSSENDIVLDENHDARAMLLGPLVAVARLSRLTIVYPTRYIKVGRLMQVSDCLSRREGGGAGVCGGLYALWSQDGRVLVHPPCANTPFGRDVGGWEGGRGWPSGEGGLAIGGESVAR